MGLERALTWAIAAISFVAPLAIGGANPPVQIFLAAVSFLITALYIIKVRRRHRVRLDWIGLAALAAVVFTAFQLIPLPAFLVRALSPAAYELRREVGGSTLMPLTLDFPATALALARAFACFGLLLSARGIAASSRRVHILLGAIVSAGVVVAALAFVERTFGVQQIFGLYHLHSTPSLGFFGTFVNGNHAASMLGLSALIALGLAIEFREGTRAIYAIASIVCITALIFTASRSGVVGLLAGGFVLLATLLVRRFGAAAGVAAALLLVLGTSAVLWTVGDRLRDRVQSQSILDNQKTRGWIAGLKTAKDHLLTGVGRGAFESPAASHRRDDEGVRLVFPENILVQMVSEWGVPISILLIAMVLAGIWPRLFSIARLEPGTLGAAAGVFAVLVHELGDFGLEMLGVAIPTVVAFSVVLARAEDEERLRRTPVPRAASMFSLLGFAVAVVLAAVQLPHLQDSEFERLHTAIQRMEPVSDELRQAIARHPANDYFQLLAAQQDLRAKNPPEAMKHLNRALGLHPSNGQAHHLAARVLAESGHASQAALEFHSAQLGNDPVSYDEIFGVIGARMIDAIPQRTDKLFDAAQYLIAKKQLKPAEQMTSRAVELAHDSEASQIERLRVAGNSHSPEFLQRSADALLESYPSAHSYGLAATALQGVGLKQPAEEALTKGLREHTEDASLILQLARFRIDLGNLDGAHQALSSPATKSFSLAERQTTQELLAQIAERQGQSEEAVLARARARLLAHEREQSGPPGVGP